MRKKFLFFIRISSFFGIILFYNLIIIIYYKYYLFNRKYGYFLIICFAEQAILRGAILTKEPHFFKIVINLGNIDPTLFLYSKYSSPVFTACLLGEPII
jgi:hypothetical protein